MNDINTKTTTSYLESLRQEINEALTYLDAKIATELQPKLEDLLLSGRVSTEVKSEFTLALAKMKFLRFLSLSEGDALDLVEHYLSLAFSMPLFDIRERIGKRILLTGDIDEQINFMDKLTKSFEKCTDQIGSAYIKLEARQLEPTIGNWIKVYLSMPSKSALRTNIDGWSFVEQGQYSKNISKDERALLLDIIRIYDSLKNRVYSYWSLPESDDEKELFQDFDLYKTLPGLTTNETDPQWKEKYGDQVDPSIGEDEINFDPSQINDTEDGLPIKQNAATMGYMAAEKFQLPEIITQKSVPPQIPVPSNAPALKPMADIGNGQPLKLEPPSLIGGKNKNDVNKVLAQKLSPAKTSLPPLRPVNIQDILRSKDEQLRTGNQEAEDGADMAGLKMGDGQKTQVPYVVKAAPNSGIGLRAPSANPKALEGRQGDIDKKLEELGKRINKTKS